MLIFFLGILIVMVLVAGGAFLISRQICVKELLIMLAVQLVIAGISAGVVYNSATSDTEVWNSRVTSKKRERTSCEHSYQCNCHPCNCSKKGGCSTCCSTCYDHSNDWNWNVYTSMSERIRIARVDRQGVREPERWSSVAIGEPVATTHSFTNYVKASPDSLFRKSGQTDKYVDLIPEYPIDVQDYYRLNRTILVNTKIENVDAWRKDLDELNATLGASKQVNIVLVFTHRLPVDYFYALEQAWIGGKKNDVVIVMNFGTDDKIDWVNTMSWESNEMFKVKMRDALVGKGLDREQIMADISGNIRMYHQRKPMAEFEYLKSAITPSMTEWIATMIIGLLVSVGMSIFFHRKEVFPEYRRNVFY